MATKTTITSKNTGDQLSASEFNQLNNNYNSSVDDVNAIISSVAISGNRHYITSRRKPTISFIFDDLTTDQVIYDIFAEFGFIPSFAPIPSWLDAAGIARMKTHYLYGCSILGHEGGQMSNPALITAEQVDALMVGIKTLIEAEGIKVSGWVTPQSSMDESFLPEMIKNYGYGFTGLNASVWDQTVDPVKLHREGLESMINDDTHSISVITARIDTAIAGNQLLVFYGHKIPSTYLDIYSQSLFNATDLRAVLTYVKTKSDDNLCQVLSTDEAIYQYYKTPFA
jgi:hypothetical protein